MYDTTATLANTTIANDAGFTFSPKRWPLSIAQMENLFDKLGTDDSYRALFMADIHAAFAQLPGSPSVPAAMTPGTCFRPLALASKATLLDARHRLVAMTVTMHPFIPQMLEL